MLNRDDVLRGIELAFADVPMPQSEQSLAVVGSEARAVVEHFFGKTRNDVEAGPFDAPLYMEDFESMTENAAKYYLPAALRMLLNNSDDDELWNCLESYLYRIGPSILSAPQLVAVADWAEFLAAAWEHDESMSFCAREAGELATRYRHTANPIMEVWDLVGAIKDGKLDVLQRELAGGYAPNTACRWTGMTALLGASEANDLVAVKLLLDAGADPNLQHSDGYTTYDSSRSRAVREALLRAGFNMIMDHPRWGRGLQERRMFAPTPVNNTHTQKLEGRTVTIEIARGTLPEPAGDVIVRVPGHPEIRPVPGDHITLPPMVGLIEVVTELIDFVGEFWLRMWDEETIATNQGARSFWLPDLKLWLPDLKPR